MIVRLIDHLIGSWLICRVLLEYLCVSVVGLLLCGILLLRILVEWLIGLRRIVWFVILDRFRLS